MKRSQFIPRAEKIFVALTLLALVVCMFAGGVVREWAATMAYLGFVVLAALRVAAELMRGDRDAI